LKIDEGASNVQGSHGHASAETAATLASSTVGPTVQKSGVSMPQITGVRRRAHTNSLTTLPKFGIETIHEDKLNKHLENLNKWGLNIFKVSEYSNNHPLTATVYTIFRVSDCKR